MSNLSAQLDNKTSLAKGETTELLETLEPLEDTEAAAVWICLRSKPKKEAAVARALADDPLVEVFCPRIRFRRPTARGAVWFQEALFPGYLFVLLHPDRDLRRVSSTQNSIGPVRFAGELATLPAAVLEALREPYAAAPDEPIALPDPIKPGQIKQIAEGPFRGLTCTVRCYFPSQQRVEILVEFLGQLVTAQVPPRILYSQRGSAEARAAAFARPGS